MTKLLSVLARTLILVVGASFLLALAVSYLHTSRSRSLPLGETRVDAITSASWPDRPEQLPCHYLIDRQSSQCNIVPMPCGNRWGQLSVSPWCDAEGNTEAVCPGFGLPVSTSEQSFWGLARLRLPAGEVIDEVKLDVLPTGRVCWVPEHPGRIMFAAADGQLYCHDFPGWIADPSETFMNAAASSNESMLSRVRWKGPPPVPGLAFVTDPFWPSHPSLRHYVFATVIPQIQESKRPVSEVTEFVWLLMSDDGAAVEASGLLHVPKRNGSGDCTMRKRFPIVEAGQDGTIRLVYVSSVPQDRRFRLELVPIEIDLNTGRPRVPARAVPRVLDDDCAPVPPLFSADGMSVYMVSRNSGLILKRQIQWDVPGKIHVASSG